MIWQLSCHAGRMTPITSGHPRRAWSEPGPRPGWHEAMRQRVRRDMPLLARALDRLAGQVDSPDSDGPPVAG